MIQFAPASPFQIASRPFEAMSDDARPEMPRLADTAASTLKSIRALAANDPPIVAVECGRKRFDVGQFGMVEGEAVTSIVAYNEDGAAGARTGDVWLVIERHDGTTTRIPANTCWIHQAAPDKA